MKKVKESRDYILDSKKVYGTSLSYDYNMDNYNADHFKYKKEQGMTFTLKVDFDTGDYEITFDGKSCGTKKIKGMKLYPFLALYNPDSS